MKILIASDLHYRLKQFDWLTRQASQCDAIIITGDVLDISSCLDISVQTVVMKKYLQTIGQQIPLLVCSGNHDGNEKNDADEYIAPWLQEVRDQQLHVDGDNVFFGTTLLTIFPWWDGDVTRQEVAEQYQPDLVVTGHIHESPLKTGGSGIDQIGTTWVLNAGSHIGDVPAHIILDLEAMNAEWYSPCRRDSNGNSFKLSSMSIIIIP